MTFRLAARIDSKAMESWMESTADRFRKANLDLSRFLSPYVYQDIIDHFEKENDPTGKKWKAWSPKYAEFMNKIGKGGNQILQDTGTLRQNMKPIKSRSFIDRIEWYNNAKTKTGFPYAAAHNYGGPTLPARPFMWLSTNKLKQMGEFAMAYLAKKKA
jgi:phage gpG-like protein